MVLVEMFLIIKLINFFERLKLNKKTINLAKIIRSIIIIENEGME